MKIVIPGGRGQIGAILARAFAAKGHELVILSRGGESPLARVVPWDGKTVGEWSREIDGCDVVINLAGRSVNCRYSAKNRREILKSRTDSTLAVGRAIAAARQPPRVWLQSSTATIYAHRYDAPNDESGILGGDEPNAPSTWRFSIDVAKAWEQAALETATPGTRLVLMRSAMTMSPDPGGVFETLYKLARRGLGGTNGDGRQFVSWIHEHDFVRAVEWLIDREDLSGPVNVASPNPLPNAEFMRILRRAAGVKVALPATKWMLELGAILLRTETELILKSRRVVPGRLQQTGFDFQMPQWRDAVLELCGRIRAPLRVAATQ